MREISNNIIISPFSRSSANVVPVRFKNSNRNSSVTISILKSERTGLQPFKGNNNSTNNSSSTKMEPRVSCRFKAVWSRSSTVRGSATVPGPRSNLVRFSMGSIRPPDNSHIDNEVSQSQIIEPSWPEYFFFLI